MKYLVQPLIQGHALLPTRATRQLTLDQPYAIILPEADGWVLTERQGQGVTVGEWSESETQQWKMEALEGEMAGHHRITNVATGHVLDIEGSSVQDRARIIGSEWQGSEFQQWRLQGARISTRTDLEGGHGRRAPAPGVVFTSRISGKAISVKDDVIQEDWEDTGRRALWWIASISEIERFKELLEKRVTLFSGQNFGGPNRELGIGSYRATDLPPELRGTSINLQSYQDPTKYVRVRGEDVRLAPLDEGAQWMEFERTLGFDGRGVSFKIIERRSDIAANVPPRFLCVAPDGSTISGARMIAADTNTANAANANFEEVTSLVGSPMHTSFRLFETRNLDDPVYLVIEQNGMLVARSSDRETVVPPSKATGFKPTIQFEQSEAFLKGASFNRISANAALRSLKVPEGLGVSLFEDANFRRGPNRTEDNTSNRFLTEDTPDIDRELVDRVSGVAIAPVVSLYDEEDFGGKRVRVGIGGYERVDLNEMEVSVRSLKIPAGMVVALFFEPGFRGLYRVFSSDSSTIGEDDLRGNVSSIRVQMSGHMLPNGILKFGDKVILRSNGGRYLVSGSLKEVDWFLAPGPEEYREFTIVRAGPTRQKWALSFGDEVAFQLSKGTTGAADGSDAGKPSFLASTFIGSIVRPGGSTVFGRRPNSISYSSPPTWPVPLEQAIDESMKFTILKAGDSLHPSLISIGDIIALHPANAEKLVGDTDQGGNERLIDETFDKKSAWVNQPVPTDGQEMAPSAKWVIQTRDFWSGTLGAKRGAVCGIAACGVAAGNPACSVQSGGAASAIRHRTSEKPSNCGEAVCGVATEGGITLCGFAACNVQAGALTFCGAEACNIDACGAAACQMNASVVAACGAAASAFGLCGMDVGGASVGYAGVSGGAICGVDASAFQVCGLDACGTAMSLAAACGINTALASLSLVGGACGIEFAAFEANVAEFCGTEGCVIDTNIVDLCGANLCAIDLCPIDMCAADACFVDVIPFIPGI